MSKRDKFAQEVSEFLIDIGAITLRPDRPFKYNTGILSPVYTDNRLLMSKPKERTKIIGYFIRKVKELGPYNVVAGVATAGIPHAAFIAQKLNLPMIYVRKENKEYGQGKQVEGAIKKGEKIIVIEDLISTGRSSISAVKAIRNLGGIVNDELAIFTYNLPEAIINFKKNKVALHVLTDLKITAEIAVAKGFLKKEQVQIILDWAKDPANWAKKMGFE